MSKYPKYLLYIKVPEFAAEEYKSKLVNELLAVHYARLEGRKKVIRTPADVPKVEGTCKHGAAAGFCKVSKCSNSRRI